MNGIETILALLVCVAALAPLADRLAVPYPILLVVGGLVLGFIPFLPDVRLRPDLVFLLFLPPLLYWDALTTPWRDFRANLRPILLLAIGLVVVTTCGVAVVAHAAIGGITWPLAFVLGAIVSPPDAIAATAIAERLGVPERIVTIVEGESLVNDATALVLYATAVGALTTSTFSPVTAGLQFVWAIVGGIGIGLIVGWVITTLRRRVADGVLETTVSLLTPFIAYLPAYLLDSSGVLAAVMTGLVVERRSPVVISSETRLQADSVWEVINFLLNGLIFILIGLQLHPIVVALIGGSSARSLPALLWDAAIVSLAVIVVRILWVFPGTYLPRLLSRRRERDPAPPIGETIVIAWTGMRGVVSLAAAQALPYTTATGAHFPQRNLIIFLSFGVILATLVVQGLSLPVLIRALGLSAEGTLAHEEAQARLAAAQAALERLDDIAADDGIPQDMIEDIRTHYGNRKHLLAARVEGREEKDRSERAQIYEGLRRELLDVERRTIIDLRNRNVINDAALRRIQRDLDLEEVRAATERE